MNVSSLCLGFLIPSFLFVVSLVSMSVAETDPNADDSVKRKGHVCTQIPRTCINIIFIYPCRYNPSTVGTVNSPDMLVLYTVAWALRFILLGRSMWNVWECVSSEVHRAWDGAVCGINGWGCPANLPDDTLGVLHHQLLQGIEGRAAIVDSLDAEFVRCYF